MQNEWRTSRGIQSHRIPILFMVVQREIDHFLHAMSGILIQNEILREGFSHHFAGFELVLKTGRQSLRREINCRRWLAVACFALASLGLAWRLRRHNAHIATTPVGVPPPPSFDSNKMLRGDLALQMRVSVGHERA